MSGVGQYFSKQRGKLSWMIALLVTVTLGACGSDHIEVERTASLPSETIQPNFIMLPATGQERARDYRKYADQVAGQLSSHGWKRVEDAAQARYAVMFSYDGDGMERASDDRHRSINERNLSKKGGDGKVQRTMSIILYDLTRPKLIDETVFGGYAEAPVDSINRDPLVIPAMIDAILKDFPGSGRETYSAGLPEFK